MSRENFNKKNLKLLVCSFLLPTLIAACVNKIDNEIQTSTVPINFSVKINNTTRVINNTFAKGDKAGLFATFHSEPISGERYIDNLKLEYGTNNTFIPEKIVFYPVGDVSLDFISYYPYRDTGVPVASSIIPVAVYPDQNDKTKHSLSDFLLAKASNIENSEAPVELEFTHKLIKLQITISPKEEKDINELLKSNPHIIATGFKTQANYDLEKNEFTNVSKETDIIPYGTWKIENGKLVGKEFIVIPQTIGPNNQSFVMEWNGQIYTCKMPELTLESSTQCALDITAMQTNSHILTGVISTIKDWTTVEGKTTDNNDQTTALHIAALSFSQSDIYRVYHKGKAIAEICKEYLKSETINSQAITCYPIQTNGKSDLSKGTVLKLMNDESNTAGGKINWDIEDNTFNYTPGNSTSINVIYFNEKGEVLTEKPETPNDINIISHTLRDLRSGSIKEYPIVKIGTQYWMKENLQATSYRDGSDIKHITEFGGEAGYFYTEKKVSYFYRGDVLTQKELAPEQWKVPDKKDWDSLVKYVGNAAILLETGEWKTNDDTYIATNETGFNAVPYGICSGKDGSTKLLNENIAAAYWIRGESDLTLNSKAAMLISTQSTVQFQECTPEINALFVRCIKE
ncbi:fimbrillin family protein [uncultured Bacteroides sp.]|uniref:fimbrillin family protein n=1 Tax=uncultured Bacteroides sp. TaxID=162156 RepID=UPI002627BF4F|nr:fimbrillin family protein [uncultured Bacteroides sp.]